MGVIIAFQIIVNSIVYSSHCLVQSRKNKQKKHQNIVGSLWGTNGIIPSTRGLARRKVFPWHTFKKCYRMCTWNTWWRHQMETFSTLLAICPGTHRPPVNSPHKGQWRGDFMVFFIYAWINSWVNNSETGDLRRHCAHYDVIVMMTDIFYRCDQIASYVHNTMGTETTSIHLILFSECR